MSLKRLFLSFLLVFILPIGNVWAPRGSQKPGNPLHSAKPTHYQRSKPNQPSDRPRPPQAKGFSKGQQKAWHKGHPRHRAQDRRTQRPPKASGYDAPRSHKTKISLKDLFAQIEGDLRRHNPRLEKQLDALCEASYQRDFNFISVSRAFSMLSRFAKNDHKRLQAIKAHKSFVPTMMQVAQQQMQDNLCDARGFASLLYGCMNIGITPDKAWMETFWQHSRYQLERFAPQGFSNTLYAAARLSLTPPEDWQQAFWTQSQQRLKHFTTQGFSNMLYAAAQLSLTLPEDWQQAFWTQSQHQLSRFKPQERINTLYAACMLNLKIPETVKPLVQSIVTSDTEEDIRYLRTMYNASDYLEAQGINLVLKEETREKLWQSEHTGVSRLEKKTGIALTKVWQDQCPQIPLKEQHFIRATSSSVDFFIESCGDQGLVIQVDGPSHFLNKGTERQCVDGFTAFQTRQLQKQGYQVLRLPYDVLETCGVYSIKNKNSPVPQALASYLKEQLSPYIPAAT